MRTAKGRISPSRNILHKMERDHANAGVYCHCCEGFWRFMPSPILKAKLDVRSGKYDWFILQRRKLWKRLYDAGVTDYERTGRDDPDWWLWIVDSYGR
jgi:hypothetical protein